MIDFIGFINGEVSLTAAKKTAMLDDFCTQYGYQELDGEGTPNPVTKKDFANEKIQTYVVDTVNATRLKAGREAVEIEELDLS